MGGAKWTTCSAREACTGAAGADGRCLAHLDDAAFERAADDLRAGERLDARGVSLDAGTLPRLLDRVRGDDGIAVLAAATFDGAQLENAALERVRFTGWVDAYATVFAGGLRLDRVTFESQARFVGSRLDGAVGFTGVVFAGNASFIRCQFGGPAGLQGTYEGSTWFEQCRFAGRADFGPTFATAYFSGSTFMDEASFWHATFAGPAFFVATVFEGQATFDEAAFNQGLDARRAHFDAATSFERTGLHSRVVLDHAVFAEDLSVAGAPEAVCARGTRFRGRTQLRLAGGTLELDGADFGGASLIAGADVRSVKGANVRDLVLSEVDLGTCEFAEAQGLETLRIEGDASFTVLGGWDKRRVIAEERAWRSRSPDALTPRRIAGIYRSLRKGLEERKNEPGAADFYYGEMEMRRHDHDTPIGERVILWLYWALSGYALRASRAFAAFLAVVLLAAIAFAGFGFRGPESFGSALLYSLGTSVRVASAERHALTVAGDSVHMALGVVGPILLGLALLSIRGRVKR